MQPPENPYEGFPNPHDPLPPLPGGRPGQSIPPRRAEISFDVISQAWTVLQSSLGVYVGSTVIAAIFIAIAEVFIISSTRPAANGQPTFNLGLYLVGLLVSVVYGLVVAGILRMAINHLRTGHADFGQVFSVLNVFPSLLLAGFLIGIGCTLGGCLCLIPGLLLNGLWMFVAPLILDRRMGAIEAMRTSFQTLKPQMWMALLFVIVLTLLAEIGIVACGIGLLFTIPLAVIALAITYRNFFPDGDSGFNFPTPPISNAPIADPNG